MSGRPAEAMKQFLAGEITVEEYVADVKRRTHAILDRQALSRPRREARAKVARERLANARRLLRKHLERR